MVPQRTPESVSGINPAVQVQPYRPHRGLCDNYLLFTNRKLSALTEKEAVEDLQQATGVANVAILLRL